MQFDPIFPKTIVSHFRTSLQLQLEVDITQITIRNELLSQLRGSDVVLRDRIHKGSRITQ